MLRTDDPTTHHRRPKTDPDGIDIEELALYPHLSQVATVVQDDQLTYHPGPEQDIGLTHGAHESYLQDLHDSGQLLDIPEELKGESSNDGVSETRGLETDQ